MTPDENLIQRKQESRKQGIKGAVFGAAIMGATLGTTYTELTSIMEDITKNVLTRATIHELVKETGATPGDLKELEPRLRDVIKRELLLVIGERASKTRRAL